VYFITLRKLPFLIKSLSLPPPCVCARSLSLSLARSLSLSMSLGVGVVFVCVWGGGWAGTRASEKAPSEAA